MFKKNENEVRIVRGTTLLLSVKILDDYGDEYKIGAGEQLKFGVKDNLNSSEYEILKELTSEYYSDEYGGYLIKISPTDTINLQFGKHYYDIGLRTSKSDYLSVIPTSPFIISENVTDWGYIT